MTQADYIFGHLLPTWLRTWRYNFRLWVDLMAGNYEVYACPWCDDPGQECREWFWSSISLDDTLPKQFLEGLEDAVDLFDKEQIQFIAFNSEDFDHDS